MVVMFQAHVCSHLPVNYYYTGKKNLSIYKDYLMTGGQSNVYPMTFPQIPYLLIMYLCIIWSLMLAETCLFQTANVCCSFAHYYQTFLPNMTDYVVLLFCFIFLIEILCILFFAEYENVLAEGLCTFNGFSFEFIKKKTTFGKKFLNIKLISNTGQATAQN